MDDDEWTIKEWRTTSEPRVIYIKIEDVPVCIVEKEYSGWKPPKDCHTRYGIVDDPLDAKNYYDYLKKEMKEMKEMKETEMDDFDRGFNEMMSASIEYERLKRSGRKKKIPKRLEKRMKESSEWLNRLSDEEYSRLIH